MADYDRPSRRFAAVLAADVAGYSRMMSEDEDATLAAWWRHRREAIDSGIVRHQGRIVKHNGGITPDDRPSERRRLTAIVLCLIIGWVGGHRFYLGRTGTAFAQLFTIGGLGLWTLADLILLVAGELKDGDGRRVLWMGRK